MCICVCDVYVCVFVLVYVCWIMCACVCTLCVQNISCDTTLIISAPDITLLIFFVRDSIFGPFPPLSLTLSPLITGVMQVFLNLILIYIQCTCTHD